MAANPTTDEIMSAIRDSGYLMEQEVATQLEQRDLHVRTNVAFEDPDEGKSREIDVVAIKRVAHDENSKLAAFVELLVECKETRTGPACRSGHAMTSPQTRSWTFRPTVSRELPPTPGRRGWMPPPNPSGRQWLLTSRPSADNKRIEHNRSTAVYVYVVRAVLPRIASGAQHHRGDRLGDPQLTPPVELARQLNFGSCLITSLGQPGDHQQHGRSRQNASESCLWGPALG